MIKASSIQLTASDASGQRQARLDRVPLSSTVGEVLNEFIPIMNLNRSGSDGQETVVEARLDREGRNLRRSELVGDSLRHEDHLVLHPRVVAGRGAGPESGLCH